MPGSRNHEKLNICLLLVLLACFLYLILWEKNATVLRYLDVYLISTFSISYLFATFFLSPDLDIDSKPYRRWKFLRILWWPYKVIFRHRGISHNLLLGPVSIVLNLALIVGIVLLIAGFRLRDIPLDFTIASIVGMTLSMEVHIVSDCMVSKMKSSF